jgi:hypothetical protein
VKLDVVLVGKNAVMSDVLLHRRTLARLTRYNGLSGKLRKLWDQLVALVGGRIDVNPFPPGSRIANSFEEVRKLEALVAHRRGLLLGDHVDPKILEEEIRFLEGEVRFHQEVVRGASETMELGADGVMVARPKTGQRTQEAIAKGYPLPAEHPEHYYYRLSETRPDVYELAIKPSAPKDLALPAYHAEVVVKDGVTTATGNLLAKKPKRPATVFAAADSDAHVVDHVMSMEGFHDFVTAVTSASNATLTKLDRRQVAEMIVAERARRAGDGVTDELLRKSVKNRIKDEVIRPLLMDDSLGQLESYKRFRALTDNMNIADRGNLAEEWYLHRFGKRGSERHVATAVPRVDKDGVATLENRVIDVLDGGAATELKTGTSPIDRDQFNAYMDMLARKLPVG